MAHIKVSGVGSSKELPTQTLKHEASFNEPSLVYSHSDSSEPQQHREQNTRGRTSHG